MAAKRVPRTRGLAEEIAHAKTCPQHGRPVCPRRFRGIAPFSERVHGRLLGSIHASLYPHGARPFMLHLGLNGGAPQAA